MIDKQAAREQVKQQERELRRSIIFNGAMKAFASYGFEATTMDHIAAMVGLAKGTLYKSFSSKEELFLSLVTSILVNQLDFVDAILADDRVSARDRFEKALGVMLRPDGSLVNARTISISVTPQMFELAPQETRTAYLAAVERMERLFGKLLSDAGGTQPAARLSLDVRALVSLLLGFKHQLGLQACLRDGWETATPAQTEALVRFLADALVGRN